MKNLKTSETTLTAAIEGIGIIGPGIASWAQAQRIFRGEEDYVYARALIPAPTLLPSAERRRAVPTVKLTLAVGLEAVAQARCDAKMLPSIFSSSGGDAHNINAICETLASSEREISPTRFHNSVHNAPAGYWSIATGATAASTALCAGDGSFAAGLLEALTQVCVEQTPVLLLVYDVDYPQPLHQLRPLDDVFGVAMVIAPANSAQRIAQIDVRLDRAPATPAQLASFETLRTALPAARGLPLLETIALQHSASVVLEYFDDLQLRVDIRP